MNPEKYDLDQFIQDTKEFALPGHKIIQDDEYGAMNSFDDYVMKLYLKSGGMVDFSPQKKQKLMSHLNELITLEFTLKFTPIERTKIKNTIKWLEEEWQWNDGDKMMAPTTPFVSLSNSPTGGGKRHPSVKKATNKPSDKKAKSR